MRDWGVRTYWSCEAQLRSCCCCVWFSMCVTDFALAVRRRNKKNVFLLRDWEKVCTLRLTRVCVLYDLDMLCVHSDYSCIILSPTTTSKIGHLRSGRVITLSALMESDQKDKKRKEKERGNWVLWKRSCDSSLHVGPLVCVFVCTNLLCRKQHAQIWFVFSCPGQETNSLWLHFSDSVQHLKRVHLKLCKVTMQRQNM